MKGVTFCLSLYHNQAYLSLTEVRLSPLPFSITCHSVQETETAVYSSHHCSNSCSIPALHFFFCLFVFPIVMIIVVAHILLISFSVSLDITLSFLSGKGFPLLLLRDWK